MGAIELVMDDDELIAALAAELERVADYLILLSRGQVQMAGKAGDLLASHRMVGLEELALSYLRETSEVAK